MCIFQQQTPRSGSGGTVRPADPIKPPEPLPQPEQVQGLGEVATMKIGKKRRGSGLTGINTNTANVNIPTNTGSDSTEVLNT